MYFNELNEEKKKEEEKKEEALKKLPTDRMPTMEEYKTSAEFDRLLYTQL